MSIILPALAVGFAAFSVWLTVRIVNRRERWAKVTAVALAIALLYPASFGPACWLTAIPIPGSGTIMPPQPAIMRCYWPFGFLANNDDPIGKAVIWWMKLGMPSGHVAAVPIYARGWGGGAVMAFR